MLDEFIGGGGVLVILGATFKAAVQVVVCCKDSSLSSSDRLMLVVLHRLVELAKRESELSVSLESSESLVFESAFRRTTGFCNRASIRQIS